MKSSVDHAECFGFGRMIRTKRRELKMNIEELAEKCERSEREVRDIELGKCEPKLGTVLRLCKACDIHIGELEQFYPNIKDASA